MKPEARALLALRYMAVKEICACTRKVVTIDAQLDELELSERDAAAVHEMRETQDSTLADGITNPAPQLHLVAG